MKKRLLEDAYDIEVLIDVFYAKILKHPALSVYFTDAIKNWKFHKDRFIKYWSAQILFTDSYEGTPLHQHTSVDSRYEHSFTKHHFDEWTRLWIETIDEIFIGDKAELAKESGANMAKNIHLKMVFNRKPNVFG